VRALAEPLAFVVLAAAACGACHPSIDGLAAQRAELARREALLQQREVDVARREQAVAAREQALAAAARPVVEAPAAVPREAVLRPRPPRPAGPIRGRDEAELRHRRALDEMQAKGLLDSDLPPEAAGLDRQVYASLRAGDYDRAFDLSEALGRAIAAVEVDRRFLDEKLRRVAALRHKHQVDAQASTEIDTLLQEATSLAADGQYGSANGRINRIAAMLQ